MPWYPYKKRELRCAIWEECVPGSANIATYRASPCLGKYTELPGGRKEPESHIRTFATRVTGNASKRNLPVGTEFCKRVAWPFVLTPGKTQPKSSARLACLEYKEQRDGEGSV